MEARLESWTNNTPCLSSGLPRSPKHQGFLLSNLYQPVGCKGETRRLIEKLFIRMVKTGHDTNKLIQTQCEPFTVAGERVAVRCCSINSQHLIKNKKKPRADCLSASALCCDKFTQLADKFNTAPTSTFILKCQKHRAINTRK